MKEAQPLSLDDNLVQIHRCLQKVNAHVNERRWSSALAGLDSIVQHANLAFDMIGAKDAPQYRDSVDAPETP